MSSKTTIPDGFVTIVKDLLSDILNTFPEYCGASFNSDLKKLLVSPIEECTDEINNIYQHCIIALPERFFDILYKNSDMFTNSDINTDFLPGINFTILWNSEGISGTIHDTIWRYLQLLVFTLVGNMGNGESFGDAAKLFEAINEDDLKQKLEETMGQMKDMFENMDEDKSNINLDDLPDPTQIHDHITGLLDGKLGRLAKEIAEEAAEGLNLDMEEGSNVNDVFQKLFRNPGKLMNLVQSVGSKLDTKIKSGDINETELMQEASKIMEKMKNMPGMGDIQELLKKMGVPGTDDKRNVKSIKNTLETNMRHTKQKERMLKKLQENRAKRSEGDVGNTIPATFDGQTFCTGEQVEKTSIKKKKNKKKKNKPPHALSNRVNSPAPIEGLIEEILEAN